MTTEDPIIAKYREALSAALPCTDRWELVPIPAAPIYEKNSTASKSVDTFYHLNMRLHNELGELVPVTARLWVGPYENWEFVVGSRRCCCDTNGDEVLGALRSELGWLLRSGYERGFLLPGVGQWRLPPGKLYEGVKEIRHAFKLGYPDTHIEKDGELYAVFTFNAGKISLYTGEDDDGYIAKWNGNDGSWLMAPSKSAIEAFYMAMKGMIIAH
jgi:hypothetical protein